MNINKKVITIIVLILFIGYFFVSNILTAEHQGFAKFARDNTPQKLKKILKETIFVIPNLKKKNSIFERDINELKNKTFEQSLTIGALLNKLDSSKIIFDKEIFSQKNKKYKLKKISLPYYDLDNPLKNKLQGYLTIIGDKLFVFFWSGKILKIDIPEIQNSNSLNFKEVTNNIDNFIKNHNLKWVGIKDAFYHNENIYLSYTKENKDNCYSVAVLKSKISNNSEDLNFEEFYSFDECVGKKKENDFSGKKYMGGYQAGGRLEVYKDNLILTVGDYNNWELPQNDQSNFGKIIIINLNKKNSKILTKGHRNPQGLFKFDEDFIFSTEHGPSGGDEINLIQTVDFGKELNFGWPISSYGNHYPSVPKNNKTKKIAPLHKSHSQYGFIEPTEVFSAKRLLALNIKTDSPSLLGLGISQIIRNNYSESGVYVSSLRAMRILEYSFDTSNKKLKYEDQLQFDERIRDIAFDKKNNLYYIFFEDTPSLGILKKTNVN
jgi:hypothetical protein